MWSMGKYKLGKIEANEAIHSTDTRYITTIPLRIRCHIAYISRTISLLFFNPYAHFHRTTIYIFRAWLDSLWIMIIMEKLNFYEMRFTLFSSLAPFLSCPLICYASQKRQVKREATIPFSLKLICYNPKQFHNKYELNSVILYS